ncbi:MAG: RrF2 family transcriptional regulator [Eubacteriales bacterium]|nr:RrF2 family transcriptional regulator [Eubacteriales bacterium]
MKISTKGRYALRVLIDLAEQGNGRFFPLKEIAERQEIYQKYLESIIKEYARHGYVIGHRGKGGGYKLDKDPDTITVKDALQMVEGDLAPVSCLATDENTCPRAAECKTLPMWEKLYKMTNDYFSGITIADLLQQGNAADMYFI